MQLGMIGLGRMGGNMVRRLLRAGHECVVFDVSPGAVAALAAEGATLATSVLTALSDDDVQTLIEDLAREHLLSPDWGPSIGGWLENSAMAPPLFSGAMFGISAEIGTKPARVAP